MNADRSAVQPALPRVAVHRASASGQRQMAGPAGNGHRVPEGPQPVSRRGVNGRVTLAALLALSALAVLSACAVTGVGYGGGVGVGYYDAGFYEPWGYNYGGWGGAYRVGPPPRGYYRGGGYYGGGGYSGQPHAGGPQRGGGSQHGSRPYRQAPAGRPMPSIPGRARGR